MRKFTFPAALAALSLPCFAQDYIGLNYNSATGATSRGTIAANAGEVMTRIDGSEVAGWGTNAPGTRTIASIAYVVQDQSVSTAPELFNIKLYPEDAANAGYPDLAAGVIYATGVAGPIGASGVGALAKVTPPDVVGVGDSVPIVGGGDVFVSFEFAAAGWSADGLSIHIVLGYAPSTAFTVFDVPGLAQGGTPPPAGAPSNSHGLSRVGTGAAVYNARRNQNIDIAHGTSGGRALGITNQTSFTSSNNPPPAGWGPAPGTGDFMSGSNPDVVGGNTGRADDIAMEYFRTGLGSGALVLFVIDFGNFGPELPVTALGVSGTGVLCTNLASLTVLGIGFTTADEAFLVSPIPAAARPSLAGLPIVQQAAGLDASGSVHASPCNRQVL